MRLLRLILDRFPLCGRRSLAAAVDRARAAERQREAMRLRLQESTGRMRAAERRAADAEKKMASFQVGYADRMAQLSEPWRQAGDAAVKALSGRRAIAFVRIPTLEDGAFGSERVEVVPFTCSVGLSADCSPELVALKIADIVKRSVLERWRSQSELLRGDA
jgi:hypothetical protein